MLKNNDELINLINFFQKQFIIISFPVSFWHLFNEAVVVVVKNKESESF